MLNKFKTENAIILDWNDNKDSIVVVNVVEKINHKYKLIEQKSNYL